MRWNVSQWDRWVGREVTPRVAAAKTVALNLLLPPQCLSCAAEVSAPGHLCSACWTEIDFLGGAGCARCGAPFETPELDGAVCGACTRETPPYTMARSVMRYDDKAKGLIISFKHADRLEGAPAFGRWLARAGAEMLACADVVTCVPLHRRRLWGRKYNQSALLAEAVSIEAARPFDPLMLERKRATPTQGGLTKRQRRYNVAGAFRVRPGWEARIKDATVVLVDDVMTTGATVESCARTLKRAGARDVHVLTLARVVLPR